MDFYPTRYNGLSNSEVNELYRSDTWSGLSREERLDALQELANRDAEELGNQPCEVQTEEMNGATYGAYSNGQIPINESLVNDGVLRYIDSEGNTIEYAQSDINAQMMDTIHHENYHAYQDDVINGRIEHENQSEVDLWRANDEMYISYSDNTTLYRIQSQERTAFAQGETQTKAAFEGIEAKYGEDSGYQKYLASINENSYESALETAKETYGNDNIQDALDNYMLTDYQENNADDNFTEAATTTTSDSADMTSSSSNVVSASDGDSV